MMASNRPEKSAGTGTSADTGARCPICRVPTALKFRPFCSRRCADLDLSRWMRGAYAIPIHADDDEDGDDAARSASGRCEGLNGDDGSGAP